MVNPESGNNIYVGRRTFSDRTASFAVENVTSEERTRKNAARKTAQDRHIDSLDPVQQRMIELNRTIQSFTDQVRLGELGRDRFKVVTKPYRLELRQLAKP